MHKRLGVFVFYNSHGVLERYVEVLLEGLLSILDELVIAVNGEISEQSMKKLQNYSKRILIRENIGYDGGAYKDVCLFK